MPNDMTQVCQPVIDRLGTLDPLIRITTANELAEQLKDVQVQLADSRRAGVRELRAQGKTLREIGSLLGLTAPRVKQIEAGYGRER